MPARLRLLLVLVYLGLGLLGARLFELQVLEHDRYVTLSRGNYLKTETIPAPRGRILDRRGVVLADNRLAYDLVYRGGSVRFLDRMLDLLGLEALPEVKEPTVVYPNLPPDLVPTLEELTAGQENLKIRVRVERTYPNPIAGPVIGYVQGPSKADLKKGYEPGDLVGKAGL
ncbi:MAG TPA: penicillin-binding protein, partial [Oceanithermus sp.]|nr:penicillin-binding protein [Oceanithermus sp.]